MSDFDFNVDDFMNTTVEGVNSTQLKKLPENWEGYGLITDIKLEKVGQQGSTKIVAKLEFSGDEIKTLIGRDKMTDNADFFVDLELGPNGKPKFVMGEGMNVGLGQFRAALGVNKANTDWTPSKSVGRSVKVKHVTDKNGWSRYRFLPSL